MAHLLGAEALHLEYPTRVVFDAVTLGVDEGDRIGIVGRNGGGKSSLLGLLSGRLTPDSGRVTRRSGIRMGVLDQSDTLDPTHTVQQAIVGDRDEHEWAGDARIRDVIAGLAKDIPWQAPIGSLSGGQRRRVALAALLIEDWDIVALDEPTNHLDVEGITWLAGHIKRRWSAGVGGLLVITHDRWFLDEVCTETWEVHDRIVEPFDGGYAAYVLQRVERDRQAATIEAKRQNLMRKELAWLRRGAPARTSKPKFRIEAANALIADVPPPRDRVELSRLATARLGKDVVDLLDVSVRYPRRPGEAGGQGLGTAAVDNSGGASGAVGGAGADEKTVLEHVEWRIAPGERTGILGANGAGKSTLLGLVTGAVTPSSGRVKRGATVRIGVLDQSFTKLEEISGQLVREVLARTRTTFVIDGKEMTPAQLLERLGFAREHLSARVSDLSGGQRRRLQLLLVLLEEPNVLILDEPTNDLDVDMLAALEDVLDSWPGTLLVVSHDRYFIERVTDQQYAVLDGRMRHLPGGLDQYLQLQAEAEARTSSGGGRSAQSGSDRGTGRGAAAPPGDDESSDTAAPQLTGAARHAASRELDAAERKVAKLTTQIEKVHAEMAAHDQSDYVGLGEVGARLRALEDELAQTEERWLELADQLS